MPYSECTVTPGLKPMRGNFAVLFNFCLLRQALVWHCNFYWSPPGVLYFSLTPREVICSLLLFPPVALSFHSSCLFGILKNHFLKWLNLVFSPHPISLPAAKPYVPIHLMLLLPIARCGLGKGLEQCFSNFSVVQAPGQSCWNTIFSTIFISLALLGSGLE